MRAPVAVLALHEARDAARNRSVLVYAAAFALLCGATAYGGVAAARYVGGEIGFGPTAAALVDLVVLFIPLLALVVGTMSLARDRERGNVAYLVALPMTLGDVVTAKLAGVGVAMTIVVCAGFGAAAAICAAVGVGGDASGFLAFAGETWLLALVMGALGVLIATVVRRAPAALGVAIGTWLALTILSDLGLLATAVVLHLGTSALLFATMLNPIEACKIAAIAAMSGSVDVLGPGGRLATDIFGPWLMPVLSAILVAYAVAAAALAYVVARRTDAA
jgi:Cu-processing system permease protein